MALYSVSSPSFSSSRSYGSAASRGMPSAPKSKPLGSSQSRAGYSSTTTTAGRGIGTPKTTPGPTTTAGRGRAGYNPPPAPNPLVTSTVNYVNRETADLARRLPSLRAQIDMVNNLSPLLAKGEADRQAAPELTALMMQGGLNDAAYAAQVEGFNAARQQAADDYSNAMAALANSDRGRADKRWLLDAQLQLQQRYYDRLAQMNAEQTAATQRQNPLLAAQKQDNSRLYELAVGALGRERGEVTDQNALAIFGNNQKAATEAGWQNKGFKIRSKTQAASFDRAIQGIESDLEKARIGKDANDRELTEKERQIADQLSQLGRDAAGNEDRRVGDYQQYLYDVSTLGRQAAEDRLRAKQAADNRRNQLASIAASQQQASVQRQQNNVNTFLQASQVQQQAAQNAMQYIGSFNQMLQQTGQMGQAQRFYDWFIKDAVERQGIPQEQAIQFLAGYIQAGNPLVIPPNAARAEAGRYKMGRLR